MENTLEITDKSLFEQYARDQWLGMEVNSDSYLFDQKIIPDFAFKVVCVRPENSIISEQTKIKIIIEDKKDTSLKSTKSDVKLAMLLDRTMPKIKLKLLKSFLLNLKALACGLQETCCFTDTQVPARQCLSRDLPERLMFRSIWLKLHHLLANM